MNANTNFPDFSSYDQELDFSPYAPTQQTTAPQTKTSEMERFWGVTGNWGEFGLYFGLGLSASLIVRAVPVLIPSAVILIPTVGAGLALMSAIAPTEDRTRYQVLLVALTAAVIGANWDAWTAWLAVNAWKIGLTLVLIGIGGYFVPTLGGKK
jgi:hypothetical protein